MTRHRRLALITGASGGLGLEFARFFAADTWDLVLVARSEDVLRKIQAELEAAHGITVTVLPADLSRDGEAKTVAGALLMMGLEPDVLVNNAGIATYGPFAESDPEEERAMLELNVTNLTVLTRLLLPAMLKRKRGHILNVASTAAFQPGPLMAAYYASKAYVLSFSIALSEELRGTGVTATCLCPGPTATGFVAHAKMETSRLFKRALVMDAPTVARIGYRACLAGKPLVVPGKLNRFGAFATRFIPRLLAARVARKAQEAEA